MKTKASLFAAGLLTLSIAVPALAAGPSSPMGMGTMPEQMHQNMQAIVNEPSQEKRQAMMDNQMKDMQSRMETCQKMMGGHDNMPMMDHSKMGNSPANK